MYQITTIFRLVWAQHAGSEAEVYALDSMYPYTIFNSQAPYPRANKPNAAWKGMEEQNAQYTARNN